ncbi:PD40 domain-containing protein [Paractinoplanes globisporus]|uniref:PD40 domain-containing protein n=1 Tax=Paractinoplanes globisporus TaxID=113565 RepID=A0ABW6W8S4_9ACTN|nr:PD40 domain-containing protein [Actinoplanes globisporus]
MLTDLPAARGLDWSPRGNTIAVVAAGDLWLVDAVTGAKRQVTNTPDVAEENPVWSPDGQVVRERPADLADDRRGHTTALDRGDGRPAQLASGGLAPPM